jgi:hypothetical protein
MGDVILNIVGAAAAAAATWFAIYFCPPPLAARIEKVAYTLGAPARWALRPFLRYMGITDRY